MNRGARTHRSNADKRCEEIVEQWQELFDSTYEEARGVPGPSFAGWKSSYTGMPIPVAEMQEWLNSTVRRIEALRPRRILDVGCGVGLLLQKLAPQSELYIGTDFSPVAVEQLRHWARDKEELRSVELRVAEATELAAYKDRSIDTIVLNSVVQYFPDAEYLFAVLQEASDILAEGGRIFIGDIRNLDLLQVFHCGVECAKARHDEAAPQVLARAQRAVERDKELVFAPDFFRAVRQLLPRITHVETLLKRGRFDNELTTYRYDVILHVGHKQREFAEATEVNWEGAPSVQKCVSYLRQRASILRLRGVPNQRVTRDAATLRSLKAGGAASRIGELQAADYATDRAHPQLFWEIGEQHGYEVEIRWSRECRDGEFDVQFVDRMIASARVPFSDDAGDELIDEWVDWRNHVNRSVTRRVWIDVEELRGFLESSLPEYMVPSAFVTLEQLPLTANGKLDRKALPAPDMDLFHSAYEPPQSDVEMTVAEVWREVLHVGRVGRHDNFFHLGGHSLLGVQAVIRMRQRYGCNLSVKAAFEHQTVAQFAAYVDAVLSMSAVAAAPLPVQGTDQRLRGTL